MKLKLLFSVASSFFISVVTFAQCNINMQSNYCVNDDPVVLSGALPGGIFSGPGVSGNVFTPSAAGAGTHQVRYINTSAYTVTQVGAFAPVGGTGTSVTLGDDQVSNALPIGFTFNFYAVDYTQFYISSNGFITFSASQPHGCCIGQQLPDIAAPNNLITFAWADLYPPGNGSVRYFTTGVAPNRKLIVNFTNIPLCCNGTPNVTAQVIMYETTNVIEIHTTMANLSVSTMGVENANGTAATVVPNRNRQNFNITNDYVRFDPVCNTLITVTVDNPPVVTLSAFADVCENAGTFTLGGGSPAGGEYSGNAVANGEFDPALAGPGTDTIYYTYTLNGACAATAKQPIIVHPAPVVSIVGLPDSLCVNNGPLALSGSPAGGTFSGQGVYGNFFFPDSSGVDIISITYNYTDTNGCMGSATQDITVLPMPDATSPIIGKDTVCETEMGIGYMIQPIANASGYTWLLPAGASIVTGTNTNMISVDFAAGASSGDIKVFASNMCGNSDTAVFPVYVRMLPVAGFTFSANIDTVTFTNTSLYTNSSLWNFGDTGSADLSTSPVHIFKYNGTYTITLTVTNECGTDTAVQQVNINGVGIRENSGATGSLTLYPNPANDLVNIHCIAANGKNIQLKLIDVNGRAVYSENGKAGITGYSTRINVEKYARGLYLLQADSEDSQTTLKIVLE